MFFAPDTEADDALAETLLSTGMYGNFRHHFRPFPTRLSSFITPSTPCAVIYLMPVLIVC